MCFKPTISVLAIYTRLVRFAPEFTSEASVPAWNHSWSSPVRACRAVFQNTLLSKSKEQQEQPTNTGSSASILAVEISSERFGTLGLEMPASAKPRTSACSHGASCQRGGAGMDRSKAGGAQHCIKAQKGEIKVPYFRETRCLFSWDWWKFFWWDPSSPTPPLWISRLSHLNTIT